MKKIGALMKDLGFRADAPIETQKAFIKHLIQAADRSTVRPISSAPTASEKSKEPTQLAFDPEILGTQYSSATRTGNSRK